MDARVTSFATAEAKARFSELIARAEAGEAVVITRHGKPVARIAAVTETPDEAVARRRKSRLDWIAYRTAHNITLGPDVTIRELIDDGRR